MGDYVEKWKVSLWKKNLFLPSRIFWPTLVNSILVLSLTIELPNLESLNVSHRNIFVVHNSFEISFQVTFNPQGWVLAIFKGWFLKLNVDKTLNFSKSSSLNLFWKLHSCAAMYGWITRFLDNIMLVLIWFSLYYWNSRTLQILRFFHLV